MDISRSFLEAGQVSLKARAARVGPCRPLPVRRWSRDAKSQVPDKTNEGDAVGKGEARRRGGKLRRARRAAEQDRQASGIDRALHVDRGVADQPDRLAGGDAA